MAEESNRRLNGIKRRVEQDRDCPEVLIQIASARAALGKLSLLRIEDLMEHRMATSFQKGKGEESIASMSKALTQVLK
jgi:DNA-binding FrmR family transcriptional regulator